MADLDDIVPLTPETAHIWVVDLSLVDSRLVAYYDLLSEDERDRVSRFKFANDRNNYIVCRAVLRKLSAQYLKMKPQNIGFAYTDFGKPRFALETALKFNVSHSGDFAVIGFIKNQTIGIDIELIKQDFDVLEIAHNFFSKKEIEALKHLPKYLNHLGFYRCWTRKEAFIKAEGSGLSFPLDSFSVSIDSDETASLLETNWDEKEKDKWSLYPFVPVQNYLAALAVKSKVISAVVNKWQHD